MLQGVVNGNQKVVIQIFVKAIKWLHNETSKKLSLLKSKEIGNFFLHTLIDLCLPFKDVNLGWTFIIGHPVYEKI